MGELLLPDYEADKPREACGVFGVYAPGEDVVKIAYLGAEALQHRGQDAAGFMVASEEEGISGAKGCGLVSEVMTKHVRNGFVQEGKIAISHTRYGTTKGSGFEAAQPIYHNQNDGRHFALAHNGHIELEHNPFGTDTDWLVNEIACEWKEDEELEAAIARVTARTDGAYSVVVMTEDRLIAFRDRHGFRPLEIGVYKDGRGYVVASETAALNQVGATHDRQILPGEIISIGPAGVWSDMYAESDQKTCAFEYVYFARPSSEISEISVASARKEMGRLLAEQDIPDADMVLGVPDSGTYAGLGFAQASGIPFELGIEKNRYITRTFIKEDQMERDSAVRLKLNPLSSIIADKRLVVVDDSIVRGTTMKAFVGMLRAAGASEVHLKISSPPYKWPCFYGMDTGNPADLLANRLDREGMKNELGVDSIDFLTESNLQRALSAMAGKLCMACMNGIYPTEVPVKLR